jgi:hypothetical protein
MEPLTETLPPKTGVTDELQVTVFANETLPVMDIVLDVMLTLLTLTTSAVWVLLAVTATKFELPFVNRELPATDIVLDVMLTLLTLTINAV